MKTTNKLKPLLEANPTAPQGYQVRVEFSNGRWAELNFSERDMATAEYNRIKAQSIYCGAWLKNISLEEVKNET